MKIYKIGIITLLTVVMTTLAHSQTVAQLQAQITALQKQVNLLTSNPAQITALQKQVNLIATNPVLALGPFVTLDPNPEVGVVGPNITFHGANIHVVSGSGSTTDNGNPTGLGNLIVGYNENPATSTLPDPNTSLGPNPLVLGDRSGSNNLVIGRWNRFNRLSFGGLVAGENNTIAGEGATVVGGARNTASGQDAAILAGYDNISSSPQSAIVGGNQNRALVYQSSILGGVFNVTNGPCTAIVGGATNVCGGSEGTLLGGHDQNVYLNESIWPTPTTWTTQYP
jgi:hypothetical protein